MGVTDRPLFRLETTYVRDVPELSLPWHAATAPDPSLLVLNRGLAGELALDADDLATPEGVATLVGNVVVTGSTPVAQAYAGHQFGGFSPRLGDGRALLLGELLDRDGHRRDLHLKGSGRTPFARGGDGKAAIGPMLREYVIGEAMHALGIPTTRALAVTATGEDIARDTLLPGAVLTRVAASHLRVGTFQFAANSEDPSLVQRLADHAIARHHPAALDAQNPYVAFFESVAEAQASLMARWMLVGFIHGVMNTDNMTISGETIDYGPCAFMEAYDPATVFSSIDHGGRYAYGNQPRIAQWNLARLAETMLPLFAEEQQVAIDLATDVLQRFPDRYHAHWRAGMRAKLGLPACDDLLAVDGLLGADDDLANDLLALLHAQRVDLTSCMRALSASVRGDGEPLRAMFAEPSAFDAWSDRHLTRVLADGRAPAEVAAAMDRVNPVYVPRNVQVEAALDAATAGDMQPFHRLVDVVSRPFDERPGLDAHAGPAPAGSGPYRTFCGT